MTDKSIDVNDNTVTTSITSGSAQAAAITGATAADPVVITAVAHGFADNDVVRLTSIGGMTELNERLFTVANKADDTFELSGEDGAAFAAWSSGGVCSVERQALIDISTPISKANPAVVTLFTGHGLTNGDEIFLQDIVGMTELNDRSFTVASAGATSVELTGEDSTGHTTHTAGGICTFVKTSAITAVTAATPPVVTCVSAHGFLDTEIVEISGVSGMTELNGKAFKIANKAATTIELTDIADADINGAAHTAYTSGGEAALAASVTNTVRVVYDDTKTKGQIVDAVQRAKEILIEIL